MFEALPAVHEILSLAVVQRETERIADRYRTRLVRRVVAEFRKKLRKDRDSGTDRATLTEAIGARVIEEARRILAPFPRRVINGTGIVIHTNLGRAPLGDAGGQVSGANLLGYSNLEWNSGTRKRGSRDQQVSGLLEILTGAESGLVINNGASALLLALNVLAEDKSVLVSRSELVEIGGGFRVPEIIEASGCRLQEVGTTNKTRLSDYQRKTRSGSFVLLKVHQSNFVQRGFVESVSVKDLAGVARKARVPLVYDNGSGLLSASDLVFLDGEPSIEQGLKDGASVVISSGDKLLGSVQAGIIVGKRALIAGMRRSPLYRALRLDKVRLALLHHTLCQYLAGEERQIPLWKMSAADPEALEARGRTRLRVPAKKSRWKRVEWVRVPGYMGGGSNPETSFESVALELVHKDHSAERLKSRFAEREIPVVGYLRKGALLIDLRTLLDDDFSQVQQAMDELA